MSLTFGLKTSKNFKKNLKIASRSKLSIVARYEKKVNKEHISTILLTLKK